MAVLVRKVETQRLQQMKMLARPGHRYIEEPALLIDLLGSAACHIRRNAAVDEVENEDHVPFLPLGRMNGRQDQIVLVELRAAGFGAAGIGRVQCQLSQKALAGGVAGGDLLKLVEVSGARRRIIVEALKLLLIPFAHQPELPAPRGADIAQPLDHAAEPRPRHGCGGRRRELRERRGDKPRLCVPLDDVARGARADAGLQLKRAVAGDRIAGVLCPAQDCEDILDMSGFEELEPAIFDERDVAPPKLDLKKVAVMSGGSGASRWWKLGWRLRWPWVKRPG